MTSILSGLDFYKLTMSQQAWYHAPDTQVTFTLKNRSKDINLLERVSVAALTAALEEFRKDGITVEDYWYLKSLEVFSLYYLRDVVFTSLPPVTVEEQDGELHVEVTGDWFMVTLWETVILSTINDLYFKDIGPEALTTGHENLSDAIRILRQYPDIKFSDFGTRRRFSLDWQGTVIKRLKEELPEQFIGTSNPHFAQEFGLKPIGTFAHEMPMVYAAMADSPLGIPATNALESHSWMLDQWYDTYGEDLSIALTDTFGSDFFFATFGEERARAWKGLRHDSGDPHEFAQRAKDFYEGYGIDTRTKTIVFSDGLDVWKIVDLHNAWGDTFNLVFGWGTSLTNNVGEVPLNIVMKATCADGNGTVKLSDDEGKHTGSPENIARYIEAKEHWL